MEVTQQQEPPASIIQSSGQAINRRIYKKYLSRNTCSKHELIVDFIYQKVTEIQYMTKQFKNSIKILFVCHGSILKSPGKARKINGFKAGKGAFYTTTTPFLN